MKFYLAINLKDENEFIKKCIQETFTTEFIPKITFENGSFFNDSIILRFLMGNTLLELKVPKNNENSFRVFSKKVRKKKLR